MATCIMHRSSTQPLVTCPGIVAPSELVKSTKIHRKRVISDTEKDSPVANSQSKTVDLRKKLKKGKFVIFFAMRVLQCSLVQRFEFFDILLVLSGEIFCSFLYFAYNRWIHTSNSLRYFSPIELPDNDSNNKLNQYKFPVTLLSVPENTRFLHSLPGSSHIKAYRNLSFINQRDETYISNLSSHSETQMLLCQQNQNDFDQNAQESRDLPIIITQSELSGYIKTDPNNLKNHILIIDCGLPLRHAEKHIEGSLLVNANDRISLRRLSTRGLKSFLDSEQLNRFEQSNIVILYDDSIQCQSCCHASVNPRLSPAMKSIIEQIKRHDSNKIVYILGCPFEQFFQNFPHLCYLSQPVDSSSSSSSIDDQSIDIDSYEMSEILPGLFLGNAHDASNLNRLKEKGIKTIINVSNTIPNHFENDADFQYHRLPCDDSKIQSIVEHFEKTFELIEHNLKNNRAILIHCQGGVSRSPSFVIGFFMKRDSKTFDQAYDFVKQRRIIINPNMNFLGQLTQYQRILANH